MMFHGRPEQQAATDLSPDDLICMDQNVYHEARGEDALGKAVDIALAVSRGTIKDPTGAA